MRTYIRDSYTPKPNDYCNAIVVDRETENIYIFDTDGVFTLVEDVDRIKAIKELINKTISDLDTERTVRAEEDAKLEEKINAIKSLEYKIVDELPETGEAGIIYLVPKEGETPDVYDEYVWVEDSFEKIGSTEVKLDDYIPKVDVFRLEDGEYYSIEIAPNNSAEATTADSIAIGRNASATGLSSTALGTNAVASGTRSVAIGNNSGSGTTEASGNISIAIGQGAKAKAVDCVAIGVSCTAEADDGYGFTTAIGTFSTAKVNQSVAVGYNAKTESEGAAAFGVNATALGLDSAALGYSASTKGSWSLAAGNNSKAGGSYDVSLGSSVTIADGVTNSIVIGRGGNVNTNYSLAIGDNPEISTGTYQIAIGQNSKGYAYNGIAIGAGATTGTKGSSYYNDIAIGLNATSNRGYGVAIGQNAASYASTGIAIGSASNSSYRPVVNASNGIAIGYNAQIGSSASYGVALGSNSKATGQNSTALGPNANASSQYSVAVGNVATASSTYAVAIGNSASASSSYNVANGASANASGSYSTALGGYTTASAPSSVALGYGSMVTGNSSNNSVALGAYSSATESTVVSVGNANIKRRIINAAEGVADNDAVIVSQLNSTKSALEAKIDAIPSAKNAADLLIVEPAFVNADGIAKDFDYGGGYLQMPYPLGAYGEYFSLEMVFTTGSDVTTEQSLIDSKYGLSLSIKNGHFVMAASSDGESWNLGNVTGTVTLNRDTEYRIRLERNNYRFFLKYVDAQRWREDISFDAASSVVMNQAITYIGGANPAETGRTAHPFKGTIDLKGTRGGMGTNDHGEFLFNDGWWWDAAGTVGLQTKANTSLTNLDAVGEARIKELAGSGPSYDTYPNATIIGNPTINGGQVSGFSTTNYLQFPFIFDLTGKTFQIDFSFTTGDTVHIQQNIIDSNYGIALAIASYKGVMSISSNGTSWDIGSTEGTFEFEENTTYYARLSWDGSVYKTAISTDGETYTDDMSITSSVAPFQTTHYIGGFSPTGHMPYYFRGIIDLNKCKMTINDELVWHGMDSLGLRTRADVSLSNIDAAGEAKIRATVADIVQTTPTIVGKYNGKDVYRYSISLAGKTILGTTSTVVGNIPVPQAKPVAFSGKITTKYGSGARVTSYTYPLPYVGAGDGNFMLVSPWIDENEIDPSGTPVSIGAYPTSISLTCSNGDYLTIDYTIN